MTIHTYKVKIKMDWYSQTHSMINHGTVINASLILEIWIYQYIFKISFTFRVLLTITQKAYKDK